MQKALEHIQKQAKELRRLEQNEQYLFDHLNNLQSSEVDRLIADLEFVKTDFTSTYFQPVNLLRLDILQKIKEGISMNVEIIEEIKTKILEKDESYFIKYGDNLLAGLKNYPTKTKSPFTNWQKTFRVCFPFLYQKAIKAEINSELDGIVDVIEKKLKLNQYKSHVVDFWGAQNFGDTTCWIALYPMNKVSHRKAYQLFLHIHPEKIDAGIIAGWDINDKTANNLEDFNSIDEVIEKLKASKETAEMKNNALINYWKYAAGENAVYWDEFYKEGIMAIGWDELGDLNNYTTDEIATILNVENIKMSNQIGNVENFRDASIGDIIISNKGKSKALGIGVITGEYIFNDKRRVYKHTRKVNWVINHLVDFEKSIFRPDTFSPTLKWNSIKEKYINSDISFGKIISDLEAGKDVFPPPKVTVKDPENQNFWWMNANPKYWNIEEYQIGKDQNYTTHNKEGNKRRIYDYFVNARPGDLVIGYQTTPFKKVKAIFEIMQSLHKDDDEGEVITFKIKEFVKNELTWETLKDMPELSSCEVLSNNQGSLFKLKKEEYNAIYSKCFEVNIQIQPYSLNDADKEIFLQRNEIESVTNLLRYKKNIVLQGPPGTGKTFIAKKLAYLLMGKKDEDKIQTVQFHQSYAYEDFIQGYRPVETGGFILKNGVFYSFCNKAKDDPDNDYFFIIDEINRGNLSKIFGELMMLIENDKRGKDFAIPLTYSKNIEDKFYIPENLYLVGTMNTADRSLAIVDYALRRRFAFINIKPCFDNKFKDYLQNNGVDNALVEKITSKISALNDVISKDENLKDNFCIGHSYFCNKNEKHDLEWYNLIIKNEIVPLLQEYWFDNSAISDKQRDILLEL